MKKMKMAIALLCTLIAVSTEALFAQTTVDFSKLAKTLEKNKKNGVEFISKIPHSEIVIQEDGTLSIPQLLQPKVSVGLSLLINSPVVFDSGLKIITEIDRECIAERIARSGAYFLTATLVAKDMKADPKVYAVTKIDGIETVEEYKAWKELEEQRNANEAAGFGRVTNEERNSLEAVLESERLANEAAGFRRVTNEERQFLEQEKADFFENPEKYFNMTVNANNTVSITGLKEEAARSLHCIYIPGDISGIPVVDVNMKYIGYWEDSTWIPSSIVFLDVPASVKSISVKLGSLSIINIAKNSRLENIILDGTHRNHEDERVPSTSIDANFENISKEFSLEINGYDIEKFTLPKKCKEFYVDSSISGPGCLIGTLIIDSSVNKLTISGNRSRTINSNSNRNRNRNIKEITTAKNANKNFKELVLYNIGNNDTNLDISNSAIETLSIYKGSFNDISLPASIKRIIQTSSFRTYLDTIHIPESVKQIVFWCKWETWNGIIDQACPKDWQMFSTSSTKTQIELRRVGYIGTF